MYEGKVGFDRFRVSVYAFLRAYDEIKTAFYYNDEVYDVDRSFFSEPQRHVDLDRLCRDTGWTEAEARVAIEDRENDRIRQQIDEENERDSRKTIHPGTMIVTRSMSWDARQPCMIPCLTTGGIVVAVMLEETIASATVFWNDGKVSNTFLRRLKAA